MRDFNLYSNNIVTALINSDAVSDKTRQVLLERLEERQGHPLFFSTHHYDLLTTLCDILMAQNPDRRICNPAQSIDKRLAEEQSDGWRYDKMPNDKLAFTNGLNAVDEFAIALFEIPFLSITFAQQVALLEKIQAGETQGNSWKNLTPELFFEDLLAEVTAIFYSHPLLQQEIGFVGMADVNGWQNIGLNSKDPIEPDEII